MKQCNKWHSENTGFPWLDHRGKYMQMLCDNLSDDKGVNPSCIPRVE